MKAELKELSEEESEDKTREGTGYYPFLQQPQYYLIGIPKSQNNKDRRTVCLGVVVVLAGITNISWEWSFCVRSSSLLLSKSRITFQYNV